MSAKREIILDELLPLNDENDTWVDVTVRADDDWEFDFEIIEYRFGDRNRVWTDKYGTQLTAAQRVALNEAIEKRLAREFENDSSMFPN